MNRDEAKALLPILTAFAEGKTIQFYSKICEAWQDTDFGGLTADAYRIKPEPRLRAWTNEEVPKFFVGRRKTDPQSGMIAVRHKHDAFGSAVGSDGYLFTTEWLFEHFVRIAEDGTEHPCGILESTTEAAGGAT